jgi:hypothetical protein
MTDLHLRFFRKSYSLHVTSYYPSSIWYTTLRYVRALKNWFQDTKSVIIIIISFLIGLGVGLAILQSIQAKLESLGIVALAWIGSLIGIFGMFKSFFKDKREEKKTPKLAFGEPYRRQDNSYFIDVALKSGQGHAQRCVGYVTVEYSDIDNSATVWEHSARREYDIGTHMGLRLFQVENNSILFPAALAHETSGFVENHRPLDIYRTKKIKIEISFVNGPKPEPYTDKISNIVDNSPLR